MRYAESLRISRALTLAVVASAAISCAPAAWAEEDEGLPTADVVIEKAIEALGGRAALEKLTNRVSTGSVEMPNLNLKGTVVVYEAAPNKNYSLAEIEGVGKTESGSDGTIHWELSSVTGPRLVEGEEKASVARLGTFNGILQWKTLYKSAQTTAVEDVGGKLNYRITLTPPTGSPVQVYFDRKTFLQSKLSFMLKNPVGDVPIDIEFSDYRNVEGIQVPFKEVMRGAGVEQVITLNSVKHNAEIAADRFNPPDPIKALAERAKPATQPKKP